MVLLSLLLLAGSVCATEKASPKGKAGEAPRAVEAAVFGLQTPAVSVDDLKTISIPSGADARIQAPSSSAASQPKALPALQPAPTQRQADPSVSGHDAALKVIAVKTPQDIQPRREPPAIEEGAGAKPDATDEASAAEAAVRFDRLGILEAASVSDPLGAMSPQEGGASQRISGLGRGQKASQQEKVVKTVPAPGRSILGALLPAKTKVWRLGAAIAGLPGALKMAARMLLHRQSRPLDPGSAVVPAEFLQQAADTGISRDAAALGKIAENFAPGRLEPAAKKAVSLLGQYHPDLEKVPAGDMARFILEVSAPFARQTARAKGHDSVEELSLVSQEGSALVKGSGSWLGTVEHWQEGIRQGALMSYTEWFRETGEWLPAWRSTLAKLIDLKASRGDRTLLIKSVGSSTGEEPYTLAILADIALQEAGEDPAAWDIRVEAYDFNVNNLYITRRGLYRLEDPSNFSLREGAFQRWKNDLGLDPRAYFVAKGNGWYEVRKDIRDRIVPIWIDLRDADQYPVLAERPGQMLFNRHTHHYLHGLHKTLEDFILGGSWKAPGDPSLEVFTTTGKNGERSVYRVVQRDP